MPRYLFPTLCLFLYKLYLISQRLTGLILITVITQLIFALKKCKKPTVFETETDNHKISEITIITQKKKHTHTIISHNVIAP